ncbi:DUF1836 domain-containing protein [uncultured Parolsenella sp.]|uniref:DUF1836 domain-containing protein n=1 Tax=uncultured Parolsenella sp. TaxID=2083008 RepID=UPI0027D93256|nr:DUF1836 domain-containing protein [uncultured Parolsenella sp.]
MGQDDEAVRELARRMTRIHISRIDEMPRIELYLDQVLSLVSGELAFMALPGEDLITGSMVNNYVKQRIVPAPVHRRYTRRHVATLLFVCAFKRVFSISEIKALYEACVGRGVNVATTYDDLVHAVELAMAARFAELAGENGEAAVAAPAVTLRDADGNAPAPDLDRIMSAGVGAVADKVFVEQMLALRR